ncbi:hypothetical protein ACQY0O_001083 [Thecaphora frezii]
MRFGASVARRLLLAAGIAVVAAAASAVRPAAAHSKHAHTGRTDAASDGIAVGLTVDLGYEIYQGYSDDATGLHVWKGIRYAAAPVGKLRWQLPQSPPQNRSSVILADSFAPFCPQSVRRTTFDGPSNETRFEGSEDCLFLSVWAPPQAERLPVLVYIHGGGYGQGRGDQDMSALLNANNNSFIAVGIQYRLGAFGFLASDEVHRRGVVNAALHDQQAALRWVQHHIGLFGGDRHRVTLFGQSAGGGSAMLQAMAYNGSQGTALFHNVIASSPYLPTQYRYSDVQPTQTYYAFAQRVGCRTDVAFANSDKSLFDCLVHADTEALQEASNQVTQSGVFGAWAVAPVTDGVLVADVPSRQLQAKRVNGRNLFVGNNGEEGSLFVPTNIRSEADVERWLRAAYPLMSRDNTTAVLRHYPWSDAAAVPYATKGDAGLTASSVDSTATGSQARANNIYAEATFVCPSYWLAEAYEGEGRKAYRWQYSVAPAFHGEDLLAEFGSPPEYLSPDLSLAIMQAYGNFVLSSNPSITQEAAVGSSTTSTSSSSLSSSSGSEPRNPATDWPIYTAASPYQINWNQTGGQVKRVSSGVSRGMSANGYVGPGRTNDITRVDALSWEGGRGERCRFWREIAEFVPM